MDALPPTDPRPAPPKGASADTSQLRARLFKARSDLVEAAPFLGALVLRLPLVITDDPRVETACVDGRGICTFGLGFLESLPIPALQAVLLHETLHLALDVFPRCGTRRALRWNISHDFAVNQLIQESQLNPPVELPEDFAPLLNQDYKGLSAEEIYDRLPLDLAEIGLGDRHCLRDAFEAMSPEERRSLSRAAASGFDLSSLNPQEDQTLRDALTKVPKRLRGELPSPLSTGGSELQDRLRTLFPTSPGATIGDVWLEDWFDLSPEDREVLRQGWREKLLEAAESALQGGQGIGHLPAWAQKLLGPLLNPQVPWQVKLAQRIHGHLCGRRRTFSRPGRRSQSLGVTLPGPIRDRGPVGVFVDVSGSVGPEDLGAFMGELVGILQSADVPVRLITWDVDVQEDLLLERPEDVLESIHTRHLKFMGGGGTDPRCVIDHLERGTDGDLPLPTFGILLTDGLVPWPEVADWPLDLLVVSDHSLPPENLGYDALLICSGAATHA